MESIKAIVLTYDKYRVFTDHMVACYEKLWPNHPFTFCIPYQKPPPTKHTKRVQYVQSPPDIKGTVLSLIHKLDDEEMVYWCIDDKYPNWLNVKKIEEIHQYLFAKKELNISGLLLCRCRGMLNRRNLAADELIDDHGNVFLKRINYEQIWIHQYLKVKVLRHMFNSFPDEIPNAKMMDDFKTQVEMPDDHQIFVSRENLSAFGESTSRGVITRNCLNSLIKYNLKIPVWASEVTPHGITMGDTPRNCFSRFIDMLTKRFT